MTLMAIRKFILFEIQTEKARSDDTCALRVNSLVL